MKLDLCQFLLSLSLRPPLSSPSFLLFSLQPLFSPPSTPPPSIFLPLLVATLSSQEPFQPLCATSARHFCTRLWEN